MLPTGHIAAGYLTAKALLHFSHVPFSQSQQNQLVVWGTFFGFAPDLDVFYVFLKQKSFLVSQSKDISHRKFYSHAPLLWFVAGVLIYLLSPAEYGKYVGLLLWLGSWSHFLLDSIEHGIMWLWPFSSKIYALKNPEIKNVIEEKNFFKHTWNFLKFYSTLTSFYLEILIIIAAIIVALHH